MLDTTRNLNWDCISFSNIERFRVSEDIHICLDDRIRFASSSKIYKFDDWVCEGRDVINYTGCNKKSHGHQHCSNTCVWSHSFSDCWNANPNNPCS